MFQLLLVRLKPHARQLKRETRALYYAYRDPRTPWHEKIFAAVVVAYAFSPIDLIPDFIPVLGYLDDLILIPLGVAIALRMIPPAVMRDARPCCRDGALAYKLDRCGCHRCYLDCAGRTGNSRDWAGGGYNRGS